MHGIKGQQSLADDIQVPARDRVERSSVQGFGCDGFAHVNLNSCVLLKPTIPEAGAKRKLGLLTPNRSKIRATSAGVENGQKSSAANRALSLPATPADRHGVFAQPEGESPSQSIRRFRSWSSKS